MVQSTSWVQYLGPDKLSSGPWNTAGEASDGESETLRLQVQCFWVRSEPSKASKYHNDGTNIDPKVEI